MISNIRELLKSIEDLMYGHNYEVCLGVDTFEGDTITDFEKQIKIKYPETHPELYPLKPTDRLEFWEDMRGKHNYRGDSGAGLVLTTTNELKLESKLQEYYTFIEQFIDKQTSFYYYNDPDGIPGYPVFWEYRFVLFTDKSKIIFIYGSSSD